MLRQLEAQESESDQETPASETPDDDASGRKSSSAMSSVYGATQSSSSSRASSPSRQHARTPSLTSRLPFRKASSSSTVATTASTSSAPAKGRHHHHVHANTRGKSGKDETGLCKWLMDGTVIYKSVGLGMMDLVVGNHLMKLAEEQHIGTRIPDF